MWVVERATQIVCPLSLPGVCAAEPYCCPVLGLGVLPYSVPHGQFLS